jgi:hypothetical protein
LFWIQGYYYHGKALLAVGRSWDARNSFAQALALSPKTQLFVEGLAEAEAAYTSTDPVHSLFTRTHQAHAHTQIYMAPRSNMRMN